MAEDWGSLEELQQEATYTPQGGAPRSVTIIPGDRVEEVTESPDGRAVRFVVPSIQVLGRDVPELAEGDQITIDGFVYRIDAPEGDRLDLKRALLHVSV